MAMLLSENAWIAIWTCFTNRYYLRRIKAYLESICLQVKQSKCCSEMELGPWTIHTTRAHWSFPPLLFTTVSCQMSVAAQNSCPWHVSVRIRQVSSNSSLWLKQLGSSSIESMEGKNLLRRYEQSLLSLARHSAKSIFVYIQILDPVLPCCHFSRGVLEWLWQSMYMIHHFQWIICISLSVLRLICLTCVSHIQWLYWRVIGNSGTQAVKTSALSRGLASFQPWRVQQPRRHRLESWELYNW